MCLSVIFEGKHLWEFLFALAEANSFLKVSTFTRNNLFLKRGSKTERGRFAFLNSENIHLIE